MKSLLYYDCFSVFVGSLLLAHQVRFPTVVHEPLERVQAHLRHADPAQVQGQRVQNRPGHEPAEEDHRPDR